MEAMLKPVKNRSLSDDVFDTLKDAIFAGRIRPGDSLREMHIAKTLSVSQATVRDALIKLESFGLVQRVPNKETIVTRHTRKEIAERVAIRTSLEETAFIEASLRMTDEDYSILESNAGRITKSFRKKEYFDSALSDLEFHQYIWQRSGNDLLCDMLGKLTMPLFAFISILRSTGSDIVEDKVAPHEDLLTALKSKKSTVIKKALREHILDSYRGFIDSDVESLEMMMQHGGSHDQASEGSQNKG